MAFNRSLTPLLAACAFCVLLLGSPLAAQTQADLARLKARENTLAAKRKGRAMVDSARARAARIYSLDLIDKWRKAKEEEKKVKAPDLPLPKPPVIDESNDTVSLPPADIPLDSLITPGIPDLPVDPLFDFDPDDASPLLLIDLPGFTPLTDTVPADTVPVVPPVIPDRADAVKFTFFGTGIRLPQIADAVPDPGNSDKSLSSAWSKMSASLAADILPSLSKTRETLNLCDWGFLQLIDRYVSEQIPRKSSRWALAVANLMAQSGHDLRLARAIDGRLVPMTGTDFVVYNRSYHRIDGHNFFTYPDPVTVDRICEARYPKTRSLDLSVRRAMNLAEFSSAPRTLKSKRYPEIEAEVCVNTNLIDFYGTMPACRRGSDEATQWQMLAATPLSPLVKKTLYPVLREAIAGKSEHEAVERLLNFVQTSLVYEYDNVAWGYERAFFPEETAYYPYADCEDRAAFFAALVRDLTGLDVAVLVYPGHVGCAVAFTEEADGDYVNVEGRRFTVCDPTYIGASPGRSMPDYKGVSVTAIIVE